MREELTSPCYLDGTCTAESSACHRASLLQWRCKIAPRRCLPSTREHNCNSRPLDYNSRRSNIGKSPCSRCHNFQEGRARDTETVRCDSLLWDQLAVSHSHLRALVAGLTVAVSIERITAGAVVALAFLFTTRPVTAGGARVGAHKSLQEMFKK